jgi:hypothetical protein
VTTLLRLNIDKAYMEVKVALQAFWKTVQQSVLGRQKECQSLSARLTGVHTST